MRSLLSRWVRPRPRLDASHLHVTVYTRSHCSCCHKAIDLLKAYQRRYRFTMDEVDIDADPDLTARFNTSVQVVSIGGKVRFKGVVNRVLLDRLLTAEGRSR